MTEVEPTSYSKDYDYDITVLSTAALPWRTGPSMFCVWHAGGFARLGYKVALGMPWLDRRSQIRLWGKERFKTPKEQEDWIRQEARHMGVPPLPDIFFFRGVFSKATYSVFVTQDPYKVAPKSRFYVVEEPEHMGWIPCITPRSKLATEKVLGIVMTNFGFYIRKPKRPDRALFAMIVEWRHKKLMRKYSDVIAPLSPAIDLQGLNHPVICQQVTGVLDSFKSVPPVTPSCKDVYFMGRLVWDKAVDVVIDCAHKLDLPIDIYGEGPDQMVMESRAEALNAPVTFKGPSYSPWLDIEPYSVFFNPSLSEVLCTTTAEALVAGRHVVIPDCPANTPFYDLANVHVYQDERGIEDALKTALATVPQDPYKARQRFDWANVCLSIAETLQA